MSLGYWTGLSPDIDLGLQKRLIHSFNLINVWYSKVSCMVMNSSWCFPTRCSRRPAGQMTSQRRSCWSTCGLRSPSTGNQIQLSNQQFPSFHPTDRIPESQLAPKWLPTTRDERHILNIDAENAAMITDLPFHYRLPFWNYLLGEWYTNSIYNWNNSRLISQTRLKPVTTPTSVAIEMTEWGYDSQI